MRFCLQSSVFEKGQAVLPLFQLSNLMKFAGSLWHFILSKTRDLTRCLSYPERIRLWISGTCHHNFERIPCFWNCSCFSKRYKHETLSAPGLRWIWWRLRLKDVKRHGCFFKENLQLPPLLIDGQVLEKIARLEDRGNELCMRTFDKITKDGPLLKRLTPNRAIAHDYTLGRFSKVKLSVLGEVSSLLLSLWKTQDLLKVNAFLIYDLHLD